MENLLMLAGILAVVMGVPMFCISVIPAVSKALSRRIEGSAASAGANAAELEALRAEVEALGELAPRLLELEERVDFAERLLARQAEPDRLEPAREDGT